MSFTRYITGVFYLRKGYLFSKLPKSAILDVEGSSIPSMSSEITNRNVILIGNFSTKSMQCKGCMHWVTKVLHPHIDTSSSTGTSQRQPQKKDKDWLFVTDKTLTDVLANVLKLNMSHSLKIMTDFNVFLIIGFVRILFFVKQCQLKIKKAYQCQNPNATCCFTYPLL